MKRYFTPEQLSEHLGGKPSPATLANWRAKRIGPSFIKQNGLIAYAEEAVEKWLNAQTVECNAAATRRRNNVKPGGSRAKKQTAA